MPHASSRESDGDGEAGAKRAVIDAAAYEERYLRAGQAMAPGLRQTIARMVRRKDVADELLQETYLRLYRAGKRDEPPDVRSMRGFLYSVARNVARDYLRRSKLDPVDPVGDDALAHGVYAEVPDHSQDPEAAVGADQEMQLLLRAVQSLPERCRQVFTLRKVYGLSYKEIAAYLKISPHTVEAQLTKSMQRCAQALGRSAPGRPRERKR